MIGLIVIVAIAFHIHFKNMEAMAPFYVTKKIAAVESARNPYLFVTTFPNPANHFVTITLYGLYSVHETEIQFDVISSNGQMLFQSMIRRDLGQTILPIKVNVSAFSTGTYIVRLRIGQHIRVTKFVKR